MGDTVPVKVMQIDVKNGKFEVIPALPIKIFQGEYFAKFKSSFISTVNDVDDNNQGTTHSLILPFLINNQHQSTTAALLSDNDVSSSFHIGQVVDAIITNVQPFGVFLKIVNSEKGRRGRSHTIFLPVSQLKRNKQQFEVLRKLYENNYALPIKVCITDISAELQTLTGQPVDLLDMISREFHHLSDTDYYTNKVYNGTVVSIQDFGMFFSVDGFPFDGMLPFGLLPTAMVTAMKKTMKVGTMIPIQVNRMDLEKAKLIVLPAVTTVTFPNETTMKGYDNDRANRMLQWLKEIFSFGNNNNDNAEEVMSSIVNNKHDDVDDYYSMDIDIIADCKEEAAVAEERSICCTLQVGQVVEAVLVDVHTEEVITQSIANESDGCHTIVLPRKTMGEQQYQAMLSLYKVNQNKHHTQQQPVQVTITAIFPQQHQQEQPQQWLLAGTPVNLMDIIAQQFHHLTDTEHVTGTVISINNYGVYFQIPDFPIGGLLHYTNVPSPVALALKQVLKQGSTLPLKVIECNLREKKLTVNPADVM